MSEKSFYVYIFASKRYGTLYIGMTSNLPKRVSEHRHGVLEGFTKTHNVKMLVYYEHHGNAESAIERERRMKEWKREWKSN